jgi:hypothetical protein
MLILRWCTLILAFAWSDARLRPLNSTRGSSGRGVRPEPCTTNLEKVNR